jgi:hypothetical protein
MNKKNIKRIREIFDRDNEICFTLEWRKSSTWGQTCALMFNGEKIDLASGCGYAKDTAMIESMLYACTGRYVSLGANNLNYLHGEAADFYKDYDLVCVYEGRTESCYSFRRKAEVRT